MKKVLIAGASGMIGGIIQNLCIEDDRVNEIISIVRKPSDTKHPKLSEIVVKDFTDYEEHAHHFKNVDAAFFCIGVYTGSVSDELFKKITVDYFVEFAKTLKAYSSDSKLCLLSGAGADRTGKARMAFARYKGEAERTGSDMGFEHFYCFRPGYIYPVEKRNEPNISYRIMRSLYPLLRLFGSNNSIKSTELAEAMFKVGMNGSDQEVLENRDILNSL